MNTANRSRFRMRSILALGLAAILLLLIGVVVTAGWQRRTMRGASSLLAEVGDVERSLLACRNREKSFLLRAEDDSALQHGSEFETLVRSTLALRQRELGREEQVVLTELEQQELEYGRSFEALVENSRQRDMDRHSEGTPSVEAEPSITFETRRLAREIEKRLLMMSGGQDLLLDFLQARRYEKNFLLYGDGVLFDDPASTVAMWDRYLDQVAARLGEATEAANLLADYRLKCQELRANVRQGESLRAQVEAASGNCHMLLAELRRLAIDRVQEAGRFAGRVGIASLALAVALFLLIAWSLTRHVVEPIETLTAMADRIEGDIQDLDVEFADLDFTRFRSRESAGLALALQRMVHRMRFLVSTERGLMEGHHMAIVLLMDRALGGSGRALVERARAAAGLEAFTDLKSQGLDDFLDKLEGEIGDLLPEDRRRELLRAIRREVEAAGWL